MYLLTGQATTLEVFPDSGVARIRAGAAEITLYHQEPPKLKATGVLFSQEDDGTTTRVLVAQNGEILLGISPGGSHEPLEGTRTAFLTPADGGATGTRKSRLRRFYGPRRARRSASPTMAHPAGKA